MPEDSNGDTELGFLLNRFAAEVPQVTHAVAVSADGLLIAKTGSLPRDRADQLAAIASGLVSLLVGAAGVLHAGEVQSNLTHMDGGFMFSMAIPGASLLVLASPACDIHQVSYQMTQLINQVGQRLAPDTRGGVASPDAGRPAR